MIAFHLAVDHPKSSPVQNTYQGDHGHLGGRWWIDLNENMEMDSGDKYFGTVSPGTADGKLTVEIGETANDLTLEKIVDLIHSLKGLAVASHVDREAFSVIGQLGFIPPGVALDALEFSPRFTREEIKNKFPQTGAYPLITSSDAHYLGDIGKSSTTFLMERVSVGEMRLALQVKDGRKVIFEEE